MGVFRKNGNWFIDYRLNNGKRKREKVGPSKKLAHNVLQKRKVEVAEGKFLDKDNIKRVKMKDFINLFVENYCKPNKSSWKDDKNRLEILCKFFGRDVYIDDIGTYQIEKFIKQKFQEGRKKATINRYLAVLKTMYNKALQWGNVKHTPIKNIKLFKENNERVRFLEKDEMVRLLQACDELGYVYLKRAIITALNTGLRKSELFGLKWSEVDINKKFIFVNRSKNHERRVIPMNEILVKTLINIKEHFTNEYVFSGKGIRKRFEKVLRYAIIKNFKWHDLRHTFASYLVMSGVDLVTVKELLGHKSLSMTMRYAHLSQSHKTRAMANFGEKMDTIWTLGKKAEQNKKIDISQVLDRKALK